MDSHCVDFKLAGDSGGEGHFWDLQEGPQHAGTSIPLSAKNRHRRHQPQTLICMAAQHCALLSESRPGCHFLPCAPAHSGLWRGHLCSNHPESGWCNSWDKCSLKRGGEGTRKGETSLVALPKQLRPTSSLLSILSPAHSFTSHPLFAPSYSFIHLLSHCFMYPFTS